jgi:hypothetical protein
MGVITEFPQWTQADSTCASRQQFKVPLSLRRDHNEIRRELARAQLEAGPIGEAAKRIADLCIPHFELEEQVVFPAFSVLHDLAFDGVSDDMAELLPLIDMFMREHERLLRQHRLILDAIDALWEAAYDENSKEYVDFAYTLRSHERMDTGIIYPTVLLIGRHLREQLSKSEPRLLRQVAIG